MGVKSNSERGTQTTSRGGGTNSGRFVVALAFAVALAGCASARTKAGTAIIAGSASAKAAVGSVLDAFTAFGSALLGAPDAVLAPWEEEAPAPKVEAPAAPAAPVAPPPPAEAPAPAPAE